MEMPDIPEFLRVANRVPLTAEQEARLAAWIRKPPRRRRKQRWGLPQNLDATAQALLRAEEKRREEAKRARLQELRERKKSPAVR